VWKIVDPEKFVKTMKSVDLALTRIDDVVYSIVRNTFGKLQFDEVISGRGAVLEKVTLAAAEEMKDYGILIVSVRVKRAVLPDENKNAVFNRMKSERYQEAALIRAEGEKEANMIRAEADKLKVIALAEAQKKAEIIKGTAEASALRIYAEAFSDDPEFYEFWKRLVVYEETLPDSKFILSPDMSFIEKLMKGE